MYQENHRLGRRVSFFLHSSLFIAVPYFYKKIRVIAITGLGLKEAKDLVDGAPKTVKEANLKAKADEIKAKLEAYGLKLN